MRVRCLWALAVCVLAFSGVARAGSLSPGLQRQLAGMAADEDVLVLVALQARADIRALDLALHQDHAPMAIRHREVIERLQDVAAESQGPLLKRLEALRQEGKVAGFTPHWLINAVVVKTQVGTVPQLADLPGVDRVEANLVPQLIEPVAVEAGRDGSEREIGITPGVVAIQADRVWYELGVRGEGAIVANMDTGVNRNHEALQARWRGNVHPAAECWLDALGGGTTVPSDGNGHGSHTMGTITGLASNDSIGVCPRAEWIASNAIAGGTGTAFDNAVIQSFEWLADPDGDPGTLDEVPDVVQNSWGVNENFAGYFDCDSRWWDAIDNCEAAGVCVTWSASNEGPPATSLRSPADRAATLTNCFSVGSVAYTPPYTISSFSSRGPSGCGGAFAVKPEVVAPGQNIYSVDAFNTTGYVYMDGTSMAGPHVAGVVGLMRSANPDIDVITIKTILMETATNLGPAGEDNTYGWGLVNAYEAVIQAMTGYGTVSGTVTGAGGTPLEGAIVARNGGSQQDATDAQGHYSLMLPAGDYTFIASCYGYQSVSQNVTVTAGETATADFALAPVPSASVTGVVRDANDLPLQGALVTVTGPGMPAIPPVVTPIDGSFSFLLPLGQQITVGSQGSADPLSAPLGPDAHGYRAFDLQDGDADAADAIVSADMPPLILKGRNRVAYAWTMIDPEAGGPGTVLNFTADDQVFQLTLPFPFRYYGQDFTDLNVASDGWVSLGGVAALDYSNSSIPDADGPAAMLAPAWEDYSPQQAASGNVSTWHDAAGGRFIIEYHHIRQYNPTSAFESFQVILLNPVLHPTVSGDGAVIFQYSEVTNIASTTMGIESPDESTGLRYYFSTDTEAIYGAGCQPIAPDLAVLFTTGMLVSNVLQPVDDLVITMLPDLRPRLGWSPASGAISYRVERAGSSGAWLPVAGTTATTWTDAYQPGAWFYRVVVIGAD